MDLQNVNTNSNKIAAYGIYSKGTALSSASDSISVSDWTTTDNTISTNNNHYYTTANYWNSDIFLDKNDATIQFSILENYFKSNFIKTNNYDRKKIN